MSQTLKKLCALFLAACMICSVALTFSVSSFAATDVTYRSVDLAFVIDTTGSMSDDISTVKTNMKKYVSRLAEESVDYRIAIVDYRDFPARTDYSYDYAYHIQMDFSSDPTAIQNGINGLSLGNGGDARETVYSGLIDGLKELTWRKAEDCLRVSIVMGDNCPLDPEPYTYYTADFVARALRGIWTDDDVLVSPEDRVEPTSIYPVLLNRAIMVYAIMTGSSCPLLQKVAQETGGMYIESTNPDAVISDLISKLRTICTHEWVETVITPASCEAVGKGKTVCVKCGAEFTTVIPAIGHTWDEGKIVTLGEKTYTCTVCGATKKEPAAMSGKCGDNLTWTLSMDGTLTISGTGAMYNYNDSSNLSPFHNQTDIKRVVIKNGATSIGNYAFYGCMGMTEVTIPDSVTSIGDGAFSGCTALTTLTVGKTIERLTLAEMKIPMDKLKTVFITDGVTKIKAAAFADCKSLKNVTLPGSMKSIVYSAFSGCTGLTGITIPNSVTSIGYSAFSGCTGLTGITIPNSVTSIGYSVFSGCTGLTGVTIPDSVKNLGNSVFSGCTGLTRATIGNGVTCIGNGLFFGCGKLAEVKLPDSAESIGDYAFSGCASLKSVTIPASVTTVGKYAFEKCAGLAEVTVPESVATIGAGAFPSGTVIYGVNNSAAQQYAKKYGNTFKYICEKGSGHQWGDGQITAEATCTVNGVKTYTCSICKATKTEAVKASGHQWDDGEITTDPTCTNTGVKTYTCFVCSETKTAAVKATGHSYGAWTKLDNVQHQRVCANDSSHVEKKNHTWDSGKITAATCTKDGVKTFTCTLCKGTKTETIPAIGHSYGAWTKLNDTQHQRVCANDKLHVEKENHAWDEGIITTPATCTKDGVKTFTCTVCKATKTAAVKATSHSYGAWEKLNDKQHQRVCANNSAHVEKENHAWDEGKITTAASCTKDGEKTFTCTVCKATKTEAVKATGHSYSAWAKLNDKQHQRVCANDKIHVEKENHAWDEGKITTPATCTKDGVKTFTCTVCKATKTAAVKATGHSYGAWTKLNDTQHQRVCTNDKTHVEKENHTWDEGKITTPATCTKDGEKTFTCTVCKATKAEAVKATGHSYGAWAKLNDTQHQRVCANDAAHTETAAHTWDDGSVKKAPSCTTAGETTYTCTGCGATVTVPGDAALGHNWSAWTALDGTSHKHVCANDPTHVETAEHDWDDGTVTTEPTDKTEGVKTFTCTVCGATKTEAIPKTEPAIPALVPGDADGDGKLTSADARLALRASVGLQEPGDVEKDSAAYLACDVDGDGKVTSADARLILRASVGLEDASKFGKKA